MGSQSMFCSFLDDLLSITLVLDGSINGLSSHTVNICYRVKRFENAKKLAKQLMSVLMKGGDLYEISKNLRHGH